MKFYQHPASPNCRKVEAVLQLLTIDAERVLVDLRSGAHRAHDYLALNPNGKVPTLVDGELILWESSAIICHLAAQAHSALYPDDARRSEVLRWMFWTASHFSPAAATVVFEKVIKPMGGGSPDLAVVEAGLAEFRRYAAVLDAHLQQRTHLVGSALTLADITAAAPLTYAQPAGLPIDEFPAIGRWLATLDEVPAWRNSAPKLG